jgi:toxoflavin synthase
MSEQTSGHDSDQYANIGETFQNTAPKLLLREFLLTPAFMEVVGDVTDKSCLDLACGDGYYTRILRHAGANRVVGADISEKMIDLAKAEEEKTRDGIEYLTSDVTALPDLGEFDLVTAVFLLHYAKSKDELEAMCRAIANSTVSSGRFVTVNTNPEFPIRKDHKYSFSRIADEPLEEGNVLHLSHYDGDALKYSFDFYHWSKDTYETALREAGFTSIEWRVPSISKEAVDKFGSDFWQDYREQPNHSIIVCRK